MPKLMLAAIALVFGLFLEPAAARDDVAVSIGGPSISVVVPQAGIGASYAPYPTYPYYPAYYPAPAYPAYNYPYPAYGYPYAAAYPVFPGPHYFGYPSYFRYNGWVPRSTTWPYKPAYGYTLR